ncbi:hypothetical protein DNU15_02285 [Salmonella enterica subsp. enterica serovar Wangata]|nr:hypothetical protein [Salmonella enterica subsp. enterica serovar Wangata]EDS7057557.1 hypothetical protein [Salmonella enterica subsp. enterica]EDT2941146.1 hypothetical protein [Salmonella enterica subsp. enterica]
MSSYFDEVDPAVCAVVERVLSRWKLRGFWIVRFDALDVYKGVTVRHSFVFSTAREAYKFKPGRAVSWLGKNDVPDMRLPI